LRINHTKITIIIKVMMQEVEEESTRVTRGRDPSTLPIVKGKDLDGMVTGMKGVDSKAIGKWPGNQCLWFKYRFRLIAIPSRRERDYERERERDHGRDRDGDRGRDDRFVCILDLLVRTCLPGSKQYNRWPSQLDRRDFYSPLAEFDPHRMDPRLVPAGFIQDPYDMNKKRKVQCHQCGGL